MIPVVQNLYLPGAPSPSEIIEPLLAGRSFQLERILSWGEASPEGFWYDQQRPEWVMLMHGTALLLFEEDLALPLHPGDALIIPPHTKHRVEQVSSDALWLALHFDEADRE